MLSRRQRFAFTLVRVSDLYANATLANIEFAYFTCLTPLPKSHKNNLKSCVFKNYFNTKSCGFAS